MNEREALWQWTRQAAIIGPIAEPIGHQVRELLTLIDGHISLVVDDLPPGHHARDGLEQARAASGMLRTIAGPVFSFLGARQSRPVPLDVRRLHAALAERFDRLLKHDQGIAVALAPRLWTVWADPVIVEQVLLCLVAILARDLPDGGAIDIRGTNITLESPGAAGAQRGDYVRLTIGAAGATGPHADYATSIAACHSLLARHGGALWREPAAAGADQLYLLLPRCAAH